MNLSTLLQAAELIIVSVGVVGALIQLQYLRRARARESSQALLQSFMSPSFVKGMFALFDLPDGLSHAEVKARIGDAIHDVYCVAATCESIGVLVKRRDFDLDVVSDFYSGPVLLYRQKFARAMDEIREATGRATIGEWGEWLADQIKAEEKRNPAISAAVEYKDWTPNPTRAK